MVLVFAPTAITAQERSPAPIRGSERAVLDQGLRSALADGDTCRPLPPARRRARDATEQFDRGGIGVGTIDHRPPRSTSTMVLMLSVPNSSEPTATHLPLATQETPRASRSRRWQGLAPMRCSKRRRSIPQFRGAPCSLPTAVHETRLPPMHETDDSLSGDDDTSAHSLPFQTRTLVALPTATQIAGETQDTPCSSATGAASLTCSTLHSVPSQVSLSGSGGGEIPASSVPTAAQNEPDVHESAARRSIRCGEAASPVDQTFPFH